MKIAIKTKNHDETLNLAKSLVPFLRPGTILLLDGDLAAGKTVFAKGIGAGLGILEHIKSPSYTLLCIYHGRLDFYHFDAYNINGCDDFFDLGFDEYMEAEGVALIEWGSVIAEGFPYGYLHVEIQKGDSDEERRMILTPQDSFHEEILKEWQKNEDTVL